MNTPIRPLTAVLDSEHEVGDNSITSGYCNPEDREESDHSDDERSEHG